jgi:hypothetical protein
MVSPRLSGRLLSGPTSEWIAKPSSLGVSVNGIRSRSVAQPKQTTTPSTREARNQHRHNWSPGRTHPYTDFANLCAKVGRSRTRRRLFFCGSAAPSHSQSTIFRPARVARRIRAIRAETMRDTDLKLGSTQDLRRLLALDRYVLPCYFEWISSDWPVCPISEHYSVLLA